MVPVKSFSSMEEELSKREADNPSIPVTVGIILAHPRSRFANDHIISYLPEYNRRVGKLLNFYMPGYYSDADCQSPVFSLKGGSYSFNESDYFEAIAKLKELGMPITESPQLILTEYRKHKLRFQKSKAIVIDLERTYNYGISVDDLFDQLIEISKKTIEYSEFRTTYLRQKKGASVIHYIKKLSVFFATIGTEYWLSRYMPK